MTKEEYKHRIITERGMQVMIECYVRNQMTIFIWMIGQNISIHLLLRIVKDLLFIHFNYFGAYRKIFVLHGFSKVTVPIGILDCLEKNELN